MQINIKGTEEAKTKCGVLILPLFEAANAGPYADINEALGGLPEKLIKEGGFKASHKETFFLYTYGKIVPESVLFIGLGSKDKINQEVLRQAGGSAASYLKNTTLANAALSTRSFEGPEATAADFIEGMLLAQYRFGAYKKEEDKKGPESLAVLSKEDVTAAIKRAQIIADAVSFARDLVTTPANDLTPTGLAKAAGSISKDISVKVIEKDEAIKLGMGAFISVSKGSMEPPKFIILEYKGNGAKPIVLIGKSITFDSGGISIKPSEGMEKMKYDMAGGAAVLGVFKAISEMKLPLHVIGILPATENLPGGTATKPGDVAKTIGGKTIEIINTDAEGRLVLADAIGYARKFFEPTAVIDVATLTGACDIALGGEAIALMSNNDKLVAQIQAASQKTGERTWQMPVYDEYKEYIKSDIADLKNTGGRSGSLVTAAYFLKEFAENTPWAHLDIASTAWTDKDRPYSPKGATGIGVRLLLEFLGATHSE